MSQPQPNECTRCASPLERSDLRCAVCGLPAADETRSAPDQTVAEILRCHGCGAAVRYDAKAQAPRCDFCDSVMEVETPDDPVEQAEAFLRFRVDPEAARKALREWQANQGFFRPGDLATASTVAELKPLWWVGWLFDADVQYCWAADSDAGARRSAWAPHAGRGRVALKNVVVPASRGLSASECEALTTAYRTDDVTDEPMEHHGATVEQFAVQRSTARRMIARGLERAAAAHARRDVPGSSIRKLSVSVLPTRLSSKRYAFSAYVLAYRYRDKLYRAVVHGQDATRVIGTAPLSVRKIVFVALAVVVLITIIGLIGLTAA